MLNIPYKGLNFVKERVLSSKEKDKQQKIVEGYGHAVQKQEISNDL